MIDTDSVISDKAEMLHAHTSQLYEWLPFAARRPRPVPGNDAERRAWLTGTYLSADEGMAERSRPHLTDRYGAAHAARVRYAVAFEISEYGPPWSAALEARLAPVLATGGPGKRS